MMIFILFFIIVQHHSFYAATFTDDVTLYDIAKTGNATKLNKALTINPHIVNKNISIPLSNTSIEIGTMLHIAISESNAWHESHYQSTTLQEHTEKFKFFIIRLLEIEDIDINRLSPQGLGSIHLATLGNNQNTEALKLLLADPRLNINLPDSSGRTALHWAIFPHLNKLIATTLIDAGISLHAKNFAGISPIDEPFVQSKKNELCIQLQSAIAAEKTDFKLIKKLLGQIPITERDEHGQTLLHLAVEKGKPELVGLLLLINPSAIMLENNKKETPVSLAIAHLTIFNLFKQLVTG